MINLNKAIGNKKKAIEAIDYYSEGEAVVFLKKGWMHLAGGNSFAIFLDDADPEMVMTQEDLVHEFTLIREEK